ncbi:DNA repair protein RadA [Candidatus Uhrbacteria bacterium RIFCSPLOWO2_02_FULL_48_12]|uniref:DNA repair protein RadA n=1 Tax=Candidatus Uhrbacteria bacterium RIFCSPLOWO2_02_FULL_48_12 TaxID=1802407 RepID=A0A1F7VBZ1_9BACT|nr:MAG: DNA repair protein RadA [Candidatus Uhrbacteria bacterium RIFCSPLOWO2_02_FULL_48_12]
MGKPQTIYHCANCDAQFPKWEGRCRECGKWDTLKESVRSAPVVSSAKAAAVIDFASLAAEANAPRESTGSVEFDRVLGGGLVPGALVLIGGDPGIGKSTLLLQVAAKMIDGPPREALRERSGVLYISGEESAEQIKNRMDRLNLSANNLKFLGHTDIDTITATIINVRPALAIIDSLNTIKSEGAAAGQPSMLRRATEKLMATAKETGVPLFLIGHITKDRQVAGPKTLEHLVDAVLYFEGVQGGPYRILRAVKNRFGGVQEIGVWRMTNEGLIEVPNPSATFLQERQTDVPGSAVTALLQGARVFLIEAQALVSKTRFGYPQRRATGFDLNRLQLLIAVLSKRLKFPLAYYDVHLNIVGGLKATEPAVDLPVALAIASALKNIPLSADLIIMGEVGLQGEVRSVMDLERRLEEASRLGFKQAVVPKQELHGQPALTLHKVTTVQEALECALSN